MNGQVLADFLAEMPDESPQNTPAGEIQQELWTLFTNGSLCVDGSGAGLILTSPKGTEFTYALRFQFSASNNEAEYEALIAGLRIAARMGVRNVHVSVDSNDRKEARKLRIKARQYDLLEGVLYRRSFLTSWLRCVGPLQAEYVIREIHEGSCSIHAGPRSVVAKAIRLGYYRPTMHRYARDMIRTCKNCQGHRTMIKSSHDDTPFSLTYGMKAVIPAEIEMPTYRTAVVDVVHNDKELRLNLDLLEERRECVAICEAKAKLKMTKYYNARVRGVTFRPGDFVYRSNDASHAMDGGKLRLKWEGPYEVTEVLGDGAYKLRSTDGTVLPRTWNIANLKRCYL
nr:reverse transcriptase domain-containing protein [Tanacetum cinerariifolium]